MAMVPTFVFSSQKRMGKEFEDACTSVEFLVFSLFSLSK